MARKKKTPVNESRIVVEGLDKPVPKPKYHDRIRIDPYKRSYSTRSRRSGKRT